MAAACSLSMDGRSTEAANALDGIAQDVVFLREAETQQRFAGLALVEGGAGHAGNLGLFEKSHRRGLGVWETEVTDFGQYVIRALRDDRSQPGRVQTFT